MICTTWACTIRRGNDILVAISGLDSPFATIAAICRSATDSVSQSSPPAPGTACMGSRMPNRLILAFARARSPCAPSATYTRIASAYAADASVRAFRAASSTAASSRATASSTGRPTDR